MKAALRLIAFGVIITGLTLAWWSRPPTFAQRWAPAIEHPLHSVSWARCLNS
jgi:hypothetical protein